MLGIQFRIQISWIHIQAPPFSGRSPCDDPATLISKPFPLVCIWLVHCRAGALVAHVHCVCGSATPAGLQGTAASQHSPSPVRSPPTASSDPASSQGATWSRCPLTLQVTGTTRIGGETHIPSSCLFPSLQICLPF